MSREEFVSGVLVLGRMYTGCVQSLPLRKCPKDMMSIYWQKDIKDTLSKIAVIKSKKLDTLD